MVTASGVEGWINIRYSNEISKGLKSAGISRICNQEYYIELKPSIWWWVRDVSKEQYRIIGKVANNYWNTYHKLGFFVTKTVVETLHI